MASLFINFCQRGCVTSVAQHQRQRVDARKVISADDVARFFKEK